jgi:hypothetical protein|tara:strand:+ start:3611 stop:4036 length:426 start_codon:yes stop_codon:yes gene_type:complete
MFHIKKYEDRLAAWNQFRETLETEIDSIQSAIDYYDQAPRVSINTDPWDNATWPDPWELVFENQYCAFCSVLGVCYSLQLTERFKKANFEIHIGIDREKSRTVYLLLIDNIVISWNEGKATRAELSTTLQVEKKYVMPRLQ